MIGVKVKDSHLRGGNQSRYAFEVINRQYNTTGANYGGITSSAIVLEDVLFEANNSGGCSAGQVAKAFIGIDDPALGGVTGTTGVHIRGAFFANPGVGSSCNIPYLLYQGNYNAGQNLPQNYIEISEPQKATGLFSAWVNNAGTATPTIRVSSGDPDVKAMPVVTNTGAGKALIVSDAGPQGSTGAPGASAPGATPAGVKAYQADALVDSMGVGTHIAYTDRTYYTNWAGFSQALIASGIRHIRDGVNPNWTEADGYWAKFRTLAAAGIGVLTLNWGTAGSQVPPSQIAACASSMLCIDGLECSNECDANACGSPTGTGTSFVLGELPLLKAAAKMLNVPCVGPSYTQPSSYVSGGNQSRFIDKVNIHAYFAGREPENQGWGGNDSADIPAGATPHAYATVEFWKDYARLQAPGKGIFFTETGYVTLAGTNYFCIDEQAQAVYVPRMYLFNFASGIERSYTYECVDEEAATPGSTNDQGHYGLLRNDMSAKPAWTALCNLITLLSDPGGNFDPGYLNYAVTGATGNLQQVLFQKRDGSFWLALWLGLPCWNVSTGGDIAVPTQAITLTLSNGTLAELHQFDHTGAVTVTTISGTSYNLNVGDAISFFKIS